MSYYIKLKDGKTLEGKDAKQACAIFLYWQQRDCEPKWLDFPGDYETTNFYSINTKDGKFIVDEEIGEAILFDEEKDAANYVKELVDLKEKFGLRHRAKYIICMGGVTSDGFVAGLMDCCQGEEEICYPFANGDTESVEMWLETEQESWTTDNCWNDDDELPF